MSQSSDVRAEINRLLDVAILTKDNIKITKQAIYDMVQKKTNAPRPTIRRIARDIRNELQSKANIFLEQSHGHGNGGRHVLDRVAYK